MKKSKIKLLGIMFLLLGTMIYSSTLFFNNNNLDRTENNIKPATTSLKIISTISVIGDVITNIVGSNDSITILVTGEEDPHTYEPTPSEITKLSEADVVFRMGITGVEPWWDSTVASINSSGTWKPTIIMVKENDMFKEDPLFFTADKKNPHIWMDPNNIKNFTYKANNTLCSLDPTQELTFSSNTGIYIGILNNLITQINSAKLILTGLKVVVYHPAFFYLLELLNVNRTALIEPGVGKEPSVADIVNVTEIMKKSECKLIIHNPQHESESVYEIARSTGSKLALLTPLLNVQVSWNGVQKKISTYKEMIEYNLWSLQHPIDPPLLSWWIFILIGSISGTLLGILFIIRQKRVRKRKTSKESLKKKEKKNLP